MFLFYLSSSSSLVPSSLVPRPFKCLPTKGPFPEPFRFSGKAILLHRIHNSLEGCRVIHGEIGEGLAVDLKSFGVDFPMSSEIAHSVFAGAGVDTLDQRRGSRASGAAVTVSVAGPFSMVLRATVKHFLSIQK